METMLEQSTTSTAAKKTQEIGLGSFIVYGASDDGSIQVYPNRGIETKDDVTYVYLDDIPLPSMEDESGNLLLDVKAPRNALTLLYGFRDSLEEMKFQYAEARRAGLELVKVEFNLDVGMGCEPPRGTTSWQNLKQSRFLNLTRASHEEKDPLDPSRKVKGIIPFLHEKLSELRQKEANAQGTYVAVHEDETFLQACERADLLCDAIRSDPRFAHINSVVYAVPDGSPKGRKVCSIFETQSAKKMVVRGTPPFEVALPHLD